MNRPRRCRRKKLSALFTVVRNLREQGSAVVFVSHRLDEVFALCDRMTVMRDGSTVGYSAHRVRPRRRKSFRLMVGREVSDLYPKLPPKIGEVVLEVHKLSLGGSIF
jgi:ABC-type sugar transport system ATPase subunit